MTQLCKQRLPAVQILKLGFIVACLVGCAALTFEQAPLRWKIEGLTREDLPSAGEVRWTYTLVIENPGRAPVTLIQQSVILAWDGVYLSPEVDQTRRPILAGSQYRLPVTSVFRRSDFSESRGGGAGRPPNAPQNVKGMWIDWQFLGRHEGGDAIILNIDFFPERHRR